MSSSRQRLHLLAFLLGLLIGSALELFLAIDSIGNASCDDDAWSLDDAEIADRPLGQPRHRQVIRRDGSGKRHRHVRTELGLRPRRVLIAMFCPCASDAVALLNATLRVDTLMLLQEESVAEALASVARRADAYRAVLMVSSRTFVDVLAIDRLFERADAMAVGGGAGTDRMWSASTVVDDDECSLEGGVLVDAWWLEAVGRLGQEDVCRERAWHADAWENVRECLAAAKGERRVECVGATTVGVTI